MSVSKFDYPAITAGAVVTEGHVRYCRENGHSTHTIDGELQPYCPRCGDRTEPAPAAPKLTWSRESGLATGLPAYYIGKNGNDYYAVSRIENNRAKWRVMVKGECIAYGVKTLAEAKRQAELHYADELAIETDAAAVAGEIVMANPEAGIEFVPAGTGTVIRLKGLRFGELVKLFDQELYVFLTLGGAQVGRPASYTETNARGLCWLRRNGKLV